MQWIMLALLFFGQGSDQATQAKPADDILMGSPNSPVRIELFSDFECPSCRAFYLDTVTRLLAEHANDGKVCIIFRDFPLPQHVSARAAARYALASRVLGHDTWLRVIEYLYTCQAEWSYDGKIESVLSRIIPAPEMAKLKEELKSPAIDKAIEYGLNLGNSREVRSTPTIFVTAGGKEQRVTQVLPFPVLKAYIDPYLK